MAAYIIRRLALMVPTLLGIMLLSFAVVQFAPGGPVEKVIGELRGMSAGATDRISGGSASGGFANYLARAVDDADFLRDLHSARHS